MCAWNTTFPKRGREGGVIWGYFGCSNDLGGGGGGLIFSNLGCFFPLAKKYDGYIIGWHDLSWDFWG